MADVKEKAVREDPMTEMTRDHKHVPFKPAGTIKVRYRKPTPLKPRKIDLDLESETPEESTALHLWHIRLTVNEIRELCQRMTLILQEMRRKKR